MSRSLRKFPYALAALLGLLPVKGCNPASSPVAAGVSIELTYPVLLIGQRSLDVRESEEDLISITGASSLNLVERSILDSEGRLYEVVHAAPETGSKPVMLDLGTSPRRFEVVVREKSKPSIAEVRELVLAQVTDPQSTWAGNPAAVEKVRSLDTVEELIAACRESWNWVR